MEDEHFSLSTAHRRKCITSFVQTGLFGIQNGRKTTTYFSLVMMMIAFCCMRFLEKNGPWYLSGKLVGFFACLPGKFTFSPVVEQRQKLDCSDSLLSLSAIIL